MHVEIETFIKKHFFEVEISKLQNILKKVKIFIQKHS